MSLFLGYSSVKSFCGFVVFFLIVFVDWFPKDTGLVQ